MKKLALSISVLLLAGLGVFGQKAEPKRISFERGKTSATVTGTLSNDQEMDFVFGAKAGQTVKLKVTSQPKGNLFDFRIAGDGFEVETAPSLAAGRQRLQAGPYDALVLDLCTSQPAMVPALELDRLRAGHPLDVPHEALRYRLQGEGGSAAPQFIGRGFELPMVHGAYWTRRRARWCWATALDPEGRAPLFDRTVKVDLETGQWAASWQREGAIHMEPLYVDRPGSTQEEDGVLLVPTLADEGVYIASESSFQRVLRAHGQTRHRGRTRAPQRSRTPTTHVATAPGQVWCWDMTYLPTQVQGRWFYLYLIQDLYSRKIVGWEIHDADDADHAVGLLKRTVLAEGIHAMTDKPVLHGDNGSTLKATTVLAMLHWLGVKPSYSRPRVSDDNAFVESLFKTAKYRPEFPVRGFATLEDARLWGRDFVRWYNFEHRHSGIRYVTPAQRHALEDRAILAARHQTYLQARERHPARWSRGTRDWTPVGAVTLNPERDAVVREHVNAEDIERLVA